MRSGVLRSFLDELVKISEEVRRPVGVSPRTWRNVEYHFSPQAGAEKWDKLLKRVSNPLFLNAILKHPDTDDKLRRHLLSLHALSIGPTEAKVPSHTSLGKSYEVKKVPFGYGCTCPDWRYRGSVIPGYECKHIKEYRNGLR